MSILLILIIFLALVFDYINGFHDAANSIATVVSTKVLTPFQAVVWAAFFNFVAFFIFKDHAVADTIAKTVKSEYITLPVIFCGLIAAICWNLITWWYGIPSSSSHTLIGGFAGAAIAHAFDKKGIIGLSLIVEDRKILQIIAFIFLAPLIGMVVAMFITIVTVNQRFFLKIGIIAVSTTFIWFVFDYFQQVKINENLSKFYGISKLKTAAENNPSLTALYEQELVRYKKASKISEQYNKIGAHKVALQIENAGLVDGLGERKMKELLSVMYRVEGLKKKAESNPEMREHTDSIINNLTLIVPYYSLYDKISDEALTDSISNALGLHPSERAQLLQGINGIHLRQDLEKQIKRADNSIIRYGIVVIAAIFSLSFLYVEKIRKKSASRTGKMFKRLQLLSSAVFSIGHGGNDAQKVMGIIAAAMVAEGLLIDIKSMPNWIPLACYTAIAAGTMSGGWKIIKTMGTKITKVTPLEGVAAETAGAMTLFMTEQIGIPVSTTHTITGAIIGVGATKRLSAVRWGVTVNLIWAWILTIPVSAILATIAYFIFKLFM
ncbi:MAG: inorganic phosphate transporter [Bacteroidetes bacterium]|nr:inorganic phosphate transporter [Bacteroidota bacterium]